MRVRYPLHVGGPQATPLGFLRKRSLAFGFQNGNMTGRIIMAAQQTSSLRSRAVLDSVSVESRQKQHVNWRVVVVSKLGVSGRVSNVTVVDRSEGSGCACVWLCGGE